MVTHHRPTGRFLPSPADIAAATALIRQRTANDARGDEDREYHVDEYDWRSWRESEKALARKTRTEREAAEKRDVAEGKEAAKELDRAAKPKLRASIAKDLAKGTAQRAADANAGTEAKPGKPRSHWRSWNVKRLAKESFLAGATVAEVMQKLDLESDRQTLAWLGEIKSDVEQRMRNLVATVARMTGVKPYRVVDQTGQLIRLRDGSGRPVDRGGYTNPGAAQEQCDAINAAQRRKGKRPPTRKQKRAARSTEIAAKRTGRGGAVHP